MSTRERILTAAAEVMRTKGLARSTTKEIARASGFSEATLYKHFANQEELFLAVLGERLPGFIALLLKDLPARVGRATVPRNLQDVARAAVAFYGQVIPLSGALFSEPVLLAHHRQMLLQKGAGPHRAIEALATYIRAEQRLGRASQSVSPEAISAMLLGACFQRAWITLFLNKKLHGRTVRRFAAEVVRGVMHGLSATKRERRGVRGDIS